LRQKYLSLPSLFFPTDRFLLLFNLRVEQVDYNCLSLFPPSSATMSSLCIRKCRLIRYQGLSARTSPDLHTTRKLLANCESSRLNIIHSSDNPPEQEFGKKVDRSRISCTKTNSSQTIRSD